MTEGIGAVVLALLPLAALGLLWALSDGRFRGLHRVRGVDGTASTEEPAVDVLEEFGLDDGLGERATLVQLSSAFCMPCRATRRVLGDIADLVPGVTHVEIDAELNLALVRRLDVRRTPTTLVLDGGGREVTRAVGAVSVEQVLDALALAVPED